MTTTIVTKRAHLTDQFKERLDRKMAKLSKFFDEDANAKVVVSTVRDKESVEVTVTSKGLLFRSEETAEDMVDSLEAVMDSLTRQILRNRKKLQDRVKKTPVELESSDPGEEWKEEFQLVRTKDLSCAFYECRRGDFTNEPFGPYLFSISQRGYQRNQCGISTE